jgi:hypothetical protein
MHRWNTVPVRLLSVLLSGLVVAGCGEETVGVEDQELMLDGPATIRILLTDAPADYIAAAEVDIGRVELLPADGGPPIVLSEDGTDGFVNLLDFQAAATTPLADAEVEAGTFAQLRLVVEAARVELIEGYAFRDGDTMKDLKVPSGAQTGIKLNLRDADDDGPLEIVPGETVIVLDFDVNRSFVLRGNPDTPAGVHGVIFKPTIRVSGMDVAASLSGTVSTELEGVSVEGLVVSATPTDGGTVPGYQTRTATSTTAADGTYTIYFLVPGSYDVTVETPEGLGTEPEAVSLSLAYNENATGVDFEVIDISGSISGTVSTALTDVSVEGLTVTATSEDEEVEPVTAATAADGTYTIEPLLPGSYVVTVEAGDDLVTDPAQATVELGPGEEVADVDFEVIEDVSGTISGTVSTSLADVSVEGLTVTATPDDEALEPVTAETAADGTYTIESVPPGAYTVTVGVGAGQATSPTEVALEVAEDEDEADVDFEVIATGT